MSGYGGIASSLKVLKVQGAARHATTWQVHNLAMLGGEPGDVERRISYLITWRCWENFLPALVEVLAVGVNTKIPEGGSRSKHFWGVRM